MEGFNGGSDFFAVFLFFGVSAAAGDGQAATAFMDTASSTASRGRPDD